MNIIETTFSKLTCGLFALKEAIMLFFFISWKNLNRDSIVFLTKIVEQFITTTNH